MIVQSLDETRRRQPQTMTRLRYTCWGAVQIRGRIIERHRHGMNLYKAIQHLYAQKETLERVIASLEELQRQGSRVMPGAPFTLKRRGRKSMNPAEREEVSKRMKKYWEARRIRENAPP